MYAIPSVRNFLFICIAFTYPEEIIKIPQLDIKADSIFDNGMTTEYEI